MQNYFNYFTEIEERFQQRRGSLLMLSTLDWALIETWREAGVPVEAVLRGIDDAFDKYDAKALRAKGRVRKVNGLGWCAQSVMEAVEAMRDGAAGGSPDSATRPEPESGFELDRVSSFLEGNASRLERSALPSPAAKLTSDIASRLRALAHEIRAGRGGSLEDLDRTLTVLEEQMFGALMAAATEDQLIMFREQSARELAPYRGKMGAVQIKQVQQQFLHKRLIEASGLPRLSLFYMSLG